MGANAARMMLAALCLALMAALPSCGGAKLSVADEQYARGEYFDAQKTYRKVYNKLTKKEERAARGAVAYKLGLCYDRLNMSARASSMFANAIRYNYPDSTAILLMARSLQAEGKYAQAQKAYNDFLLLAPDSKEARNGLAGCRLAAQAKAAPTRYVVRNAKLFNSRRSDYAPMFISRSEPDQLYFSTTNEKVTGDKRSEITGMKKGDIWFARQNEKGEWQRPEPVEGELNTELDEGAVSFTPDGQTMYLSLSLIHI